MGKGMSCTVQVAQAGGVGTSSQFWSHPGIQFPGVCVWGGQAKEKQDRELEDL